MLMVMKENISQCQNVYSIDFGQQWMSMVQKNKIYQALAANEILVCTAYDPM